VNLLSSAGDRLPGCTLFVNIATTDAFDKKPLKKGMATSSKIMIVKDPIVIKPVGMKPIDETSKVRRGNQTVSSSDFIKGTSVNLTRL